MQHNWNELSESTKNFMRNQNFKQELREAYQQGYRDSVTEYGQLDEYPRLLYRVIKRAIDAGGDANLGGGLGDDIVDAAGAIPPLTGTPLENLQTLLANFPSNARALGVPGIMKMLKGVLSGDLTGKALQQQMIVFNRLMRQFGYEFFDNNGVVGIRPIRGFDMDTAFPGGAAGGGQGPFGEQEFWETVIEQLQGAFGDAQIPWNPGFGLGNLYPNELFPQGGGGRFVAPGDDLDG